MKNKLIRDALAKHDYKQWELAEIMGISEFSLSRKMRHELPEEEQKEIVSKIEEYANNNERS